MSEASLISTVQDYFKWPRRERLDPNGSRLKVLHMANSDSASCAGNGQRVMHLGFVDRHGARLRRTRTSDPNILKSDARAKKRLVCRLCLSFMIQGILSGCAE